MIITKLRLVNVGRHTSLSFDSDASVVGLLGVNGVGKSTVLDMLQYALTGETEFSLDSYVRYGEGNSCVEVEFVKNGQKGTIFRQFGKTSKRKLTWAGQEKTSAKEVDATMAQIFSADKQAIANAVFVQQGTLEKILFSKDADRRSMFIKLVNMSFCAKRANTITSKLQKLESTIVDLGPAIQAVNSQRETSAIAVQKASEELAALPDYSIEVEFCDTYITNTDLLKRTVATIGQCDNEKAAYHIEIERLLKILKVISVEDATSENRMIAVRLQMASSAVASFDSNAAELSHYDRVSREIQEARDRLNAALKEIKDLNPDGKTPEQIAEAYRVAKQQADIYPWRRQTEGHLQQWKKYQQDAEVALQTEPKPDKTEEELKTLNDEYSALGANIHMVKTLLGTQSRIAGCLADQLQNPTAKCPDCGLTIASTAELQPERLEEWRARVKTMEAEWLVKQDEIVRLNKAWKAYHTFYGTKSGEVATAKSEINNIQTQLDANVPTMAEDVASAQVELTSNQKQKLPLLKKNSEQAAKDVTTKMLERGNYATAQQIITQGLRDKFTPEEGKRLREAQAAALKTWEEWQQPYTDLSQTCNFLERTEMQIKNLNHQKHDLEKKIDEPMPVKVIELSMQLAGNIEAVKAEFKNRNDVRQQAVGRQEQAQKNYDQVNQEYQDLRRRAEMDVGKRKLIDDLKLLRQVLNDDGLPMAVVRYHFEQMAALTQEALSQLDANFAIMIDRDRSLAFKFVRLDEPVQYEMPMDKLSGGQKVRLCVAFLLACQKRLVQEVGLLVLDEPSNHMDPSGVESLSELLIGLRSKFKNTEMQVWVSDHNPGLADCFDTVLKLS
jgi:DNA repair exonuclease SbcCD ATPase subunit